MSTSSVGRPGKYQRSVGGLVAALVVTVLAIAGAIWVLGLFRSDHVVDPDQVDSYLATVEEAQESGLEPVYPSSLPDGWDATGYDVTAGKEPVLELRILTDDEEFVGIHQASEAGSDLVREYVDDEATAIDIYSVRGSVAEAWQGYEDDGGDTAYVAEVGKQTVLVWGSASPEELQDLIGRLTTDRVR